MGKRGCECRTERLISGIVQNSQKLPAREGAGVTKSQGGARTSQPNTASPFWQTTASDFGMRASVCKPSQAIRFVMGCG